MPTAKVSFDFDAFISHASQDKAGFVTPLANELRKQGVKIWFDKFTLKVGDKLYGSIEKGLARSRYGIVVLSPSFLAKNWPQAELSGLFAREMDGHKVILPVWHKLSSARMKQTYPMLADKVALRSSDGVQAVARSLIEVIRPELLVLDNKIASAFEATAAFEEEARRKYPGFDFAIISQTRGSTASADASSALPPKRQAIQISVSNPALITSPLVGSVEFFGEGVKKAMDFERTGRAQKWEPEEFKLSNWNIPLMPPQDGCTFQVGSRIIPSNLARHLRVEVGFQSPIIFPVMEMRSVRIGSEEAEVLISDEEEALIISLVIPLGNDSLPDVSRKIAITVLWELTGKRSCNCRKLIEAVDALRCGSAIRFVDIRLDIATLVTNTGVSSCTDPFSRIVRNTILLVAQIEREFSLQLRMPETISEEDGKSLLHLDCLLNGHAYQTVHNSKLRFVKADGELGVLQESFLEGKQAALFTDLPSDYLGYFALFGRHIKTRSWIRFVEFLPTKPRINLDDFRRLPLGTELVIDITAKGPARLRWKDDVPAKSVDIGLLT